MNYSAKPGLKPEAKRRVPRSSAAGRKNSVLLWTAMIAVSVVSVLMLTSLGQSILITGQKAVPETKTQNLLRDNPVFSPLIRQSRLNSAPFAPGIHVVYDGGRTSAPDLSWSNQSTGQWWVPDDEEFPGQSDRMPGAAAYALQQKSAVGNLHPRLRSTNIDPSALLMDSISMGVADLLSTLREKDIQRQAGPDTLIANPFAEALKKASEEIAEQVAEPEDTESAAKEADDETAESEPKTEEKADDKSDPAADTAEAEEPSGGSSPHTRSFLFVGAFGDQPLATAVGSAAPELTSRTVTFEMSDRSNQAFDMDVVLRDRANPESVAFGDLNVDGFVDMVVTNKARNTAEVFINNGQSNYILTSEIWAGLGPAAAVIGDFNADRSPDVAVITQIDKRIVVDGKGYRRFILPTSAVNDEYSAIIPFDFDGDGLNDVLLSSYRNLTAAVYINQGSGFFAPSSSYALQAFPCIQSASDLNGDGIPDLIYIQYLGNYISITMQNGRDGSFSGIGNMMLDPALHYVIGDFNQDGVADIAAARRR